MPYIKAIDREKFQEVIEALKAAPPKTPGEINYLFSMIAAMYVNAKPDRTYQVVLNDIIGAAECFKQEWYRRVGGPLEDAAIKRNGDL